VVNVSVAQTIMKKLILTLQRLRYLEFSFDSKGCRVKNPTFAV